MKSLILFALCCMIKLQAISSFPANPPPILIGQQVTPDSGPGTGEPAAPYGAGDNATGSGSVQPQQECPLSNEADYVASILNTVSSKLNSILQPLKQVPLAVWNTDYYPVSTQSQYSLTVLLTSYSLSANQTDCTVLQQLVNTSLSLMQCYADRLGSILTNVTNQVVHNSDSNLSDLRGYFYQAYHNATVTKDMSKLVNNFPSCYKLNRTLYTNIDCSAIVYSLPSCSSNTLLCHQMTSELLDMMVIASGIAFGIDKIKSDPDGILSVYRNHCLVSSGKAGNIKKKK